MALYLFFYKGRFFIYKDTQKSVTSDISQEKASIQARLVLYINTHLYAIVFTILQGKILLKPDTFISSKYSLHYLLLGFGVFSFLTLS